MTWTCERDRGRSPALVVPADLAGPSGGTRYDERMITELAETGLDVTAEPVPGAWPSPTEDDRAALRHALGRHDEVLVDGLIGSAAPEEIEQARARGARVGVLVHLPLPAEGGLDERERARLAALERRALHAAGTVVATSGWADADLRERYGLTHVHAVAPGTDRAETATGSTPPHLLALGSITPRKNPLGLLEALGGLQDRHWNLSLVGPRGSDEGYVRAVTARAEALQGRVRMPGSLEGDALEALWRTVDLLVLPSQTETYGMVVTEALAHGIPALVPSGTGAVEALHGSGERDGLPGAGAVVAGTREEGWAEALRGWLDDPGLRDRWRRAAAGHRDRLRGWDTAAAELRAVLRW
ncbi:Glycosyl transferase, group 1 [Serinicoccus hydrothermalis]|uniref:Glycosyl transferase, group 1 n=1 Tax=Serinicoccus hydrothermalis TaxID=1758689 RepID=A0A1B1N905_9MICO|nr:glycosyltransferase family 4 protein [Serinicoccus hydrothermalis]ANS77898.1 Glycosyl transferase, group 1 [Serinicoccus hydrothermalis]